MKGTNQSGPLQHCDEIILRYDLVGTTVAIDQSFYRATQRDNLFSQFSMYETYGVPIIRLQCSGHQVIVGTSCCN